MRPRGAAPAAWIVGCSFGPRGGARGRGLCRVVPRRVGRGAWGLRGVSTRAGGARCCGPCAGPGGREEALLWSVRALAAVLPETPVWVSRPCVCGIEEGHSAR